MVASLAAWVALVAGGGEGRPWPVLWLLAGLVAAFAVGRLLSGRPGLLPQLVAVGVAGSMILTWPGLLHAEGAPLGYANGNATLTSLGVIAALAAARSEPDTSVRRGWLGLAGLLAAMTLATGSIAGLLALLSALALLGLSAVTRWAGFAIVGGLIAISITVGITTAVALGSDIGGLGERTEVRGELWAAAAELARAEPLRGIGPGEFAERNPVSDDADLRWAHHGYLQVAAEYGLIGLLFVAAVIGWAWAALWNASGRHPVPVTLVAAALAIVGLHAAVDYVWHLSPVLIVTSALYGDGTARRSSVPVDSIVPGGAPASRFSVVATVRPQRRLMCRGNPRHHR